MPEEKQSIALTTPTEFDHTKFTLARGVLLVSFAVIGLLGIVALFTIAFSAEPDKVSAVQNILSIFLPMFGTWVGTIIAFYFSKENFEAASRSTQQLTKDITEKLTPKQILETTKVKDAMLPIENVSVLVKTETDDKILLKRDILDAILIKYKRNRLPILDQKGHVVYMLHRSILEQFIVKRLGKDDASSIDSLSLADLIADSELKHFALDSFMTVNAKTSLAEVKTLMDHLPYCADIFVTEDGSKATRATGWITNNIVLAKANI